MIELGLYEHYKGMRYLVIGAARHSETLEPMVIYRALYNDCKLWVRPLAMFKELIIHEGVEKPRFKKIVGIDDSLPPEISTG